MNMPLWFSNLLFWSAQIILLVLVAGLLPRLFQIRQPRVLLAYWRALLAVSLLLPVIQPWRHLKVIGMIVLSSDFAALPPPSASGPVVAHWRLPNLEFLAAIVAVVILAGIAARFVILVMGLLKLRQFRKASSPISLCESAAVLEEMLSRVNTSAEFRISADVPSPVTFGFSAPVILLPERFPSMAPRFQSAIACHELLHVRRRDWAHHLLEEIIRAIFWFHPAIAWLIARVRLVREQVVDLEVVRLTSARKTYMEALLEFAVGRGRWAAIPAPPFLVERQLAERVALMLKEVRMSRTRLIVSLTSIICFLALTVTLAVRAFPLKAISRNVQNAPQSGVAGGVSGGVSGGISGGVSSGVARGVSGGLAGGIGSSASRDIPTVFNNTIWIDTVKRGPMVRQVRGLGTLVRAKDSANLIARVMLPESMTKEVHANQNAAISTQKGPLATGHVISVGREVVNETVTVDISLDTMPRNFVFGGPETDRVDAAIDIEKIEDVLYVGVPLYARKRPPSGSTVPLFKISKDGAEAVRVDVKLGRASVNTIEILDGLKEGDKIILSDMSTYENANRIHLK